MATTTDAPTQAQKGRRVTIDLTPAAAAEVDRLRDVTGLTTADIFRHAMSLFRIYVDARAKNEELRIIHPERQEFQTRIELPVSIDQQSKG